MAELSFNAINKDGTDLAALYVAADAAGDTFPSGNSGIILIKNDDASPHSVTVVSPVASQVCGNFGDQDIGDVVVTVPASGEYAFTIPSGYAANSLFTLTYDAVTSVTVCGISANPV